MFVELEGGGNWTVRKEVPLCGVEKIALILGGVLRKEIPLCRVEKMASNTLK